VQSKRAKAATKSDAGKAVASPAPPPAPAPLAAPAVKAKKLSFKEQRELDELPGKLEALEAEQKVLSAQLADPELYKSDPAKIRQAQARFEEIDELLLPLMERWEELGKR